MAEIIVEVEQGKLRGKAAYDIQGGKFYCYHGIPYAKPPVGELRFKAPVSPDSWEGIRDANKEANAALSRDFVYNKIVGSEDCLYLNVYTPNSPRNANRLKAVMLWIHGGALTMGSSKTDIHGPENLISEDIVLVTINYRLGVLGFLSMKNPKLGVPGNAGLKDVVMSLKWVERNIKKFGGDPNNITIFGVSAGAALAHCLMLSPMAKGLFHRVILQSGTALQAWIYGGQNADKVAKILGFDNPDEEAILEFLMTVPSEKILEAQDNIKDRFGCDELRSFGIVVEEHATEPMFFSEHPLTIMKSGNYNKVPIIIGYTSREGLCAEASHIKDYGQIQFDTESKIPHFFNVPKGTELSLQIANKIQEAYYGSDTPSYENIEALYDLETDVMYFREIYKSIKIHLKTLNHPIYFYVFSADTSLNVTKSIIGIQHSGACHADDVGYLFKTKFSPRLKYNSLEAKIIRRMVKLWTNFAKNGNPNPPETDHLINVIWEPVTKDPYKCLDIGSNLDFVICPDIGRMKVWDEIESFVPNAKV